MSSINRRGLRLTVAAVGLAALGLGLAGTAFAAAPENVTAPTSPAQSADPTGGLLGQVSSPASSLGGLQQVLGTVTAPKVNTDGTGLPAANADTTGPDASTVTGAAGALQGTNPTGALSGATQGDLSTGDSTDS